MTDTEKNNRKDIPADETLKDSVLEDVAGGFTFEKHMYSAREYANCGITFVRNQLANDQFFYNGRPIKEQEANEIVENFAERRLK